jgi:hypothetical protein
MKKWNDDDLPETTFCTTHKGIGGGDLYAHQIAEAFDAVTDMRYVGTGIGRRFRKFYDFDHRFKHTGSYYEPEIMIGCSHFESSVLYGSRSTGERQHKSYTHILTLTNSLCQVTEKNREERAS